MYWYLELLEVQEASLWHSGLKYTRRHMTSSAAEISAEPQL